MEITKREIIASISIIAVMLLIGLLISEKISEWQIDQNDRYNKAIKIENTHLFQYGMDTNVGNAFVYGDLEAVDTVTYPEIGGDYMYIEKVKEQYTMHTRTYTTTDGKGHTQTHVQTYWTWDRVGSEELKCRDISFCGVVLESSKIKLPDTEFIDTIKESSHVRYKYYGVSTKYTGTIFTELRDGTISDGSSFYNGKTIQETVDMLEDGMIWQVIFWCIWLILIVACVYGFYYADNRWLEDT